VLIHATITVTTGQNIVDGCVRDGRQDFCALFTRFPPVRPAIASSRSAARS